MFGSNIRSVLSRQSMTSAASFKRLAAWAPHNACTTASFTRQASPALSAVATLPPLYPRYTHNYSSASYSHHRIPTALRDQRRHQSAPAAAAQRASASPQVNIASQFPSAFSNISPDAAEAQPAAQTYPHHITLVKKVKKDGSPCRKCVEVLARIEREGYMHRIDRIVVADEANPMSEGMVMAQAFKVKTAPFFLVDSNVDKTAETQLFTVYFKLKREILAKDLSEEQKLKDIQESPQVQELVDFV